jgi:hypothetical protein
MERDIHVRRMFLPGSLKKIVALLLFGWIVSLSTIFCLFLSTVGFMLLFLAGFKKNDLFL